MLRRRQVLQAVAAGLGMPAFTLPGVRARAASSSQWRTDWASLTAAARKEGKLSIATVAGGGYRKWIAACEPAFPGIEIEHQQFASSGPMAQKILSEREAGVFSFDGMVMATVAALPELRPRGALDKLRPQLIRPDVLDNRVWTGGFEAGWVDGDRSLGYAMSDIVSLLSINTDLVREGQIKTVKDLLDPKWRGKTVMLGLGNTTTVSPMTAIR